MHLLHHAGASTVAVLTWPTEACLRAVARASGVPCLFAVEPGEPPPFDCDRWEDWVSPGTSAADATYRGRTLAERWTTIPPGRMPLHTAFTGCEHTSNRLFLRLWSMTCPAPATPHPDEHAPLARLGSQERAVLSVLAEKAGRVVSRAELAQRAGLANLSSRRCDSLLVGIRRVVGADAIVTVRRRGWMLVPGTVDPNSLVD